MRFLPALLLALALAGCNSSSPTPQSVPVPGGSISMAPAAWAIEHSPGMPANPTQAPTGWTFVFPSGDGSYHVDYVVAPVALAISGTISASINVTAADGTVFGYATATTDTADCPTPAHVRLFFQERGDDLSGAGPLQYYRWWSTEAAYQLAPGAATLSAALDPGKWSSVLGLKGDASAAAAAGFQAATQNVAAIGFTFGGGCSYGHGVYVTAGSASFGVSNFTVQ